MRKPCFVLQLEIDRGASFSRTDQLAVFYEALVPQFSELIDIEVSVNGINTNNRGQFSSICLNQVPDVHQLPAHPTIYRRSYARKLKIERSRIYRRLRRYDLRISLILVRQGRIIILLGNHPVSLNLC